MINSITMLPFQAPEISGIGRNQLALDERHEQAHHNHSNQDIEQDAKLDNERHTVSDGYSAREQPILNGQQSDDLHNSMATTAQNK